MHTISDCEKNKVLIGIGGISYSTLNRMMNAGEIQPVFGRNRKLLFCPDAVDAMICSRQSLPILPPPAVNPAKQYRKAEADFATRQFRAEAMLLAHSKGLGINHLIVASRNHLLPKDGKAPRPKFHLYLPLSVPLHDSNRFVLFCEWCIDTFAADPKVKSKAQKIFGYGDNPHAFVEFWNGGRCVDEVLTDDDLFSAEVAKSPIVPSARSNQESGNDFDWFAESGEWYNHLPDLEALPRLISGTVYVTNWTTILTLMPIAKPT